MAFWGLLLIAIGVGAMTDLSLWPLVFIVAGIEGLLPIVTGRRRYGGRYSTWYCWWEPPRWQGSRRRRQRADRGPQSSPEE